MWSNLKRPHARVFVAAVYITLKCWKEARQLEGRLGPPVTINPSTHWAPACQFGITMQTVCVSGIESALATTKRRSQGSKSLHPPPHFLAPLSANLLEALQALHCSTSHSLSKFPESKVHSHPSPDTLVQGTSHLHLPTSRDGSRPSCSTSLQHLKADHLPSCMQHSLLLTSERPHGWFSSSWPPTFSFPLPPPGETLNRGPTSLFTYTFSLDDIILSSCCKHWPTPPP